MNKIREAKFDILLEKALEESFREEVEKVKIEKFPLSSSFKKKMTKLIKQEDNWKRNLLKKVALYLLIFVGASSLLISTNETARAAFQSLWDWANEYRKITWFDDHLSIDVKPKNEDNIRVEFKEEFIPDGYKINKFKKFGSSYDISVLDKSGKEINIIVIKNSAAIDFGLDNEHTNYINREIGNKNYLIGCGIDKEFGNFILVEHKGYYYDIHSYDVTEDQLIDLAEKIFKKIENSL